MTTKEHLAWLDGYDCAMIDWQIFLRDNKKMFSPSTFKSFAKVAAKKFYRNNLAKQKLFVKYQTCEI